jgi:DNA-binding LacI/PurR family transcriptional regulator
MPMETWGRSVDAGRRVVRMAVLVHGLGDYPHDWYSPAVLAGVDEMAGEEGVTIELVGDRDCDVRAVSGRLMQSRPDVLVCLAPAARHALLMGESLRQRIPVIGTGSFLTDLGIPTVCEDGRAAAAEAVRYLVSRGHRRIGFVQMGFGLPMVFARHRGYLEGLEAAGIEADEGLVLWMRRGEPDGAEAGRLRSYLERRRPTAILCGACWPLEHMAGLVRAGEVRVPGDVSVVNFDQHPVVREWLGGVRPTVVALPLREMGRELARMARRAATGEAVEKVTYVRCRLEEGESVRDVRDQQ